MSTQSPGIVCRKCGSETFVWRTEKKRAGEIVRRRVCANCECGERYMTLEVIAHQMPPKNSRK